MRAFSVVGITKSGKTTTIEQIIRELKKRSFSVGTIKDIHYQNFTIDKEGTNTYRHMAAGSELVAARGYNETDILYPAMLPIEDLLKLYVQDYVAMEGVSDYNVPIILCAHNLNDIKKHMESEYFGRVFAISGVLSNIKQDCFEGIPIINAINDIFSLADIIQDKVFEILPDFSPQCCTKCGFGCRELCSRILKGISKRSDCRISKTKIILKVGGKKISMVPFVQNILTDSLIALIQNLKGYKKGEKIEITLND